MREMHNLSFCWWLPVLAEIQAFDRWTSYWPVEEIECDFLYETSQRTLFTASIILC
jgi:hypothetical protein